MKKSDLRELVELGARAKLRAIERQLAAMWEELPDLFLSPTAPQLLRPEPRREGVNGNWPPITVTPVEDDENDVPTPKRRGKGRKKSVQKTNGIPIDVAVYQRIYEFLEERPGATGTEVAKHMKVHPANIRHKLMRGVHRGFFAKKDLGFHAKAVPSNE